MDEALGQPEEREHVTISLSMKSIAIVFGILIAVWVFRELSNTLLIFVGAILLATSIDRPARALEHHGMSRAAAIGLIFALVIGILTTVVVVLIPVVTNETEMLRADLPTYQKHAESVLNRITPGQNKTQDLSLESLTTRFSDHLDSIASSLTKITLQIGHAAIVMFAMLVISFMVAMNPTNGTRFARRFLTADAHARMVRISGEIHERIGGWVRGQVLVAVTFGILFGLGLWAIGVPFAASIALAAGVLEVIPYLGGALTVVIAMAVAITVGVPQTILVLVLYVVLVNVESHILAPTLIGGAVGLPSVVVLGALFIGLETKGILGVLLAVPTVLVVMAILDEFWPAPETEKEESGIDRMQHRLIAFFARFTRRT